MFNGVRIGNNTNSIADLDVVINFPCGADTTRRLHKLTTVAADVTVGFFLYDDVLPHPWRSLFVFTVTDDPEELCHFSYLTQTRVNGKSRSAS